MVEGTGFMGNLKTDADFFCVLFKYFLIRDNDKPGGIAAGLIHARFNTSSP